jgi:hypothetical protein
MPSPTAEPLADFAHSTLDRAGIRGENDPGLARALAKTTAQALALFLNQAQVQPGIPVSAPPPANSGSTVGPGSLMPPPAGGPVAAQLENLALADLQGEGIAGENAPALAKLIAGSLAQAIERFTAQVQVAPGIAISGLVTTSPGSLI